MSPISPKPLFLTYLGLPWAVLAPTSWLEMQTDTSERVRGSAWHSINNITLKYLKITPKCNVFTP